MKQTAYTISSERRQGIVNGLCAELDRESAVRFAYLYGSLLESDTVHDVDVGLYLEEDQIARASGIADALSAKLSAEIGIPVDIRILNSAPLSFMYHVLRGALLVSRDEVFLTDMMEEVARRYLDLSPFLRQGTKDAFAA
jgi:predicted nucleotidyltransferase